MHPINRRQFGQISAVSLATAVYSSAWAQAKLEKSDKPDKFDKLDKTKIILAVVGKATFSVLPLIIAEQLGYFEAEGIDLEMVEYPSTVRAQQALNAGNADVVCGAFENVFSLNSKQLNLQSFVSLCRAPQLALGVSTKNLPNFSHVSDLKGKKIGIAAPGTGTSMMVNVILHRAGLQVSDVSSISVGTTAGAMSAVRAGQVDAICNLEPTMTLLEQKGEIKIISDARTLSGARAIFGGDMPGTCLFAPIEYLQKQRLAVQGLTNAIVHALKWLQTAGSRDLIRTVPEVYMLGDRGLYLSIYNNLRESISPDGVMSSSAAQTAYRTVASFELNVKSEKIDIARTYTNTYAMKAKHFYSA